MMKILAAACALVAVTPAFAGTMMAEGKESKKTIVEPCPSPGRLLFSFSSSYVFESDFERGNNATGDAWGSDFQIGYRIPLGQGWPGYDCGEWNLRLGARYSRFDYSHQGGLPIPNHLQGIAGVIALEYLVQNNIALILETRPGVYFENDVNSDSFDAPSVIAGVYRFNDHFTGIIGATYGGFREYPLLPVLGFVWNLSDSWTLSAVYPQPRLTYKAGQNCAVFVGGEFIYESYRVDDAKGRPSKLDNAVVSYTEYRAGAGFTYQAGAVAFEVAGGYAFQREFDFHRADEQYKTDEGAPYLKVEVKTAF